MTEPVVCAQCDAEWPDPGPRFCGGCGARLHGPEAPTEPGDGDRTTWLDRAGSDAPHARRVAQVVGAAVGVALLALLLNAAFGSRADVVGVLAPDRLDDVAADFDEPIAPDANPEECGSTGCFIGCAPPRTLDQTVRWCRDHGGSATPPALSGARAVLIEPGALVGVERVTGEQRWRIPIGDTLASSPTVTDPMGLAGQLVLVADGTTDRLTAVSLLDGTLAWRGPPGSDGRATAVGNTVLVVGSTGLLWSLDGITGEPDWQTQTRAPAWRAPVVTDSGLVVTLSLDGLDTYDLETGRAVWRRTLGLPSFEASGGSAEDGRVGAGLIEDFPVLGPVVAGDRVIIATTVGTVVALAAADGTNLWDRPFGTQVVAAPVVSGERVFVLTADDLLQTLDLTTGTRFTGLKISEVDGPNRALVADRDLVYVTTGQQVRQLSAADRSLNQIFDLGRAVVGSPIVSGQTLYVTTRQALYAFDTS